MQPQKYRKTNNFSWGLFELKQLHATYTRYGESTAPREKSRLGNLLGTGYVAIPRQH